MSYVIANGFERELGVDQPLDARVTERVRSRSMHFNPSFLKVEGYRCAHTASSKRALRGNDTKKEQFFLCSFRCAHTASSKRALRGNDTKKELSFGGFRTSIL